MRKKKKLKVKLPSSKKVSLGMTKPISLTKDELKVALREERYKELDEKQKITAIKIENRKLKEITKWPDYHTLGDKNSWTMPISDAVNRDMLAYEDMSNRIMMMEINNIASFAMSVITCIFITTVFLLWVLWP